MDLAVACAVAWACEPRSRGAAAVRMATDQLHAADPAVWRHLFALSDHRTRRRALTEALRHRALGSGELIALALADSDVTVAHSAAESVLRQSVALDDAPLSPAAEAVVKRILAARIPQVRAAAVTVLRRGQRPDLAVPLLLDRSALVRETARWVLRSHGQDPAAHCREQIDRPGAVTTAGAVSGLAECGDAADVPWLRTQLANPGPKARAAAVRALAGLALLNVEELLALLEQDPAPSVGRAAVAALVPEVHRIPRARLQAWLSPERRPKLRAHAAVLLRATG